MKHSYKKMLKRYSRPVKLLSHICGDYEADTGKWVRGMDAEENIIAPVTPLSDDDLRQGEGGEYTSEDRRLYLHQKVDMGTMVEVDGVRYKVSAEKDYACFANGLRVYIMTRKGESDD